MDKEIKTYRAIGLMSGTSLDGLDIADCSFTLEDGRWLWKILKADTIPYPDKIRNQLQRATASSALEIHQLDLMLGRFMGNQVQKFLDALDDPIDLIASHGHTIFHQPQDLLTVQIGNLQALQQKCNQLVIGDFRKEDVLRGGQGAPLVPIGDKLLFSEHNICVNLGGIANLSYDQQDQRLAYDVAPCNMLFNHLARLQNKPFDKDGAIAKGGKIIDSLLHKWDALSFYATDGAKSLGYEWVHENLLKDLDSAKHNVEDLMRTCLEHSTNQLAACIQSITDKGRILFTGGGSFNKYYIKVLKQKLDANYELVIPDELLVSYKEALVFAFLGVLKYRNEINILSSATGAREDSTAGVIVGKLSR